MQVVAGSGFQFEAPASWPVTHGRGRVVAGSGPELVQVATFTLLRPYSRSLFGRVSNELRTRMAAVAVQTGGRLAGSETVKAGGIPSHSYRVEGKDRVDQYTFVLRGRHEYQLLCRRSASSDDAVCRKLIATFAFV